MVEIRQRNHDRINAVVAGIVFLFTLGVYIRTVAPTLSFWDCGEFIAASYLLAVPHPPGTPLYVVIGRVFASIPFVSDIGLRVNLVSAFFSAGTALFGYLIASRVLQNVLTEENSTLAKVFRYGGAFSGAMFMAFSVTNWNNSVEAEVYGMAMCLFMAILWLGMRYVNLPNSTAANRLAVLVFFIASLGIGVHMLVFAALPLLGLHFSLKKSAPRYVWHALAIFAALTLYFMFVLSSRPNEVAYYVPIAIVAIAYLFYMFSDETIPRSRLIVAAGFLLSCAPLILEGVVGFINGRLSEPTPSAVNIANYVGISSFVLLLIWSAIGFVRDYKQTRSLLQEALIPWYFVATALFMTLMVYFPKGYTSFLLVTAILAIVLFAILRYHLIWTMLIALVSVCTIVLGIKEYTVGAIVGIAVVIILGLVFKMKGWRTAVAAIMLSVIGMSIHIYLPIRAAQDPIINESDPSESMYMFVGYLERKQYGSQSMIERIFERRATWQHQFGEFERTGFWYLLRTQYGLSGPGFTLLLIIGLFGLWEMVRRNPRIGWTLAILLLLTSVGLVLYMNFADGTRMDALTGEDQMEVRSRDYFYTPAFLLFALSIGVGTGVTLHFLRESAARFSPTGRKMLIAVSMVLLLLPAVTIARNYEVVDRADNYLAYDYAHNLLSSCKPNAVLFTGGDNDTFPVWCLQYVYGIRRDVVVVNLSLANTHWYMQQIRDFTHVDLPLTNEQTRALRNTLLSDGRRLGVHNQVADAIIDNNLGRIPIHFTTSTGQFFRKYHGRQADSHLTLNGLIFDFRPDSSGLLVDVESTLDILDDSTRFRTRGVNDPEIFKDDATTYLVHNYGNVYLMVADSLRNAGDYDRAHQVITTAYELLPSDPELINFKASLMADQGNLDGLATFVDTVNAGDPLWLKTIQARAYMKNGSSNAVAESLLIEIIAKNPSFKPAFETLSGLYYSTNEREKLIALLRSWLSANPNDNAVRNILSQMEHSMRRDNRR